SVAEDLHKLINDNAVDEVNVNGGAIHAIWTLHGLGLLSDGQSPSVAVVLKALKHPAAGVRRAAIQTLPKNAKVIDELISSGAVQDKDLRVRLAAILALSEAPPSPKVARSEERRVGKECRSRGSR